MAGVSPNLETAPTLAPAPWHEALGDAIAASPIGKMFGMGKKSSRTSVVEKVAEPEPAAAAPVRRSSRLRN